MNPDASRLDGLSKTARDSTETLLDSRAVLAMAEHLDDPPGQGQQERNGQQQAVSDIHAGERTF